MASAVTNTPAQIDAILKRWPRILVTGAGGQLGRAFKRLFNAHPIASRPAATEIFFSDLTGDVEICNLADEADILRLLDRTRPDLILNPGAYTAVDKAESEPDLARAVNTAAPATFARWAKSHGATLVHYSTDYVFDGTGTKPWKEADPTGPASVYGQTKLDGERAMLETGVSGAIFRTSWVYSDEGHNFIKTMLRLAAEREELRVVADQIGVPTNAHFLARMTVHALSHWAAPSVNGSRGNGAPSARIWHLVPRGEISWHQFAEKIIATARQTGMTLKAAKVTPITTADYPTPARRPLNSRLDCTRFETDFSVRLDDWTTGFDEVMRSLVSSNTAVT
jgi:dTDP-4-dehydrorhamnose reductase